jgi:MOSC domain-containing protein YiiM
VSVAVTPTPPTSIGYAAHHAGIRFTPTRPMTGLRHRLRQFARPGRLEAIVLRPARETPAVLVESVLALAGRGLAGDRSAEGPATVPGGHARQVTLIQAEHLPLLARWMGLEHVDALGLRRNLVVSGFNLLSARSPFSAQPVRVKIGAEVEIEITGPCDPCAKMEALLGPGGLNAMRGHGGVTARIVSGGRLALGDIVTAEAFEPPAPA